MSEDRFININYNLGINRLDLKIKAPTFFEIVSTTETM